MVDPEWRSKAAVPVSVAGTVMSLSKNTVYRMVRDSELRSVVLGGKMLIPVVEILRLVGENRDRPPTAEEVGLALLRLISVRSDADRQADGA